MDQRDATVTNGLVRLGINREGQLNVGGFDSSSGTGSMPPEVVASTNDGFASADPRALASDLGRRGLCTDLGPADHGALFDIALPEIDPGESVSFTMFHGAPASSRSWSSTRTGGRGSRGRWSRSSSSTRSS